MASRRKELKQNVREKLDLCVHLFIRYVKENSYAEFLNYHTISSEEYFSSINEFLLTAVDSLGMGRIKTFEDVMAFEVKWYEAGGCCPWSCNDLNLRKDCDKILFCLAFFIEDIMKPKYHHSFLFIKHVVKDISKKLNNI